MSHRARCAAVAAPVEDGAEFGVIDTPLVPCNNLRAHWEIGADGRLEMRWDLMTPASTAPVTPMKLRPYLPPHPPARRSA